MKGEKMLNKVLLALTGAVILVSITGCTPKIVSSEGGVYQNNRLFAVTDKNMDTVYEAALQANDKLELKVVDKAKDAFGAKVIAKSSDDKKISIWIEPTKNNKTMYDIKVGRMGDEERSRMIFDEMNKTLTGQK